MSKLCPAFQHIIRTPENPNTKIIKIILGFPELKQMIFQKKSAKECPE